MPAIKDELTFGPMNRRVAVVEVGVEGVGCRGIADVEGDGKAVLDTRGIPGDGIRQSAPRPKALCAQHDERSAFATYPNAHGPGHVNVTVLTAGIAVENRRVGLVGPSIEQTNAIWGDGWKRSRIVCCKDGSFSVDVYCPLTDRRQCGYWRGGHSNTGS